MDHRSTTRTEVPPRAASSATERPAIPAPTTMTSASRACFAWASIATRTKTRARKLRRYMRGLYINAARWTSERSLVRGSLRPMESFRPAVRSWFESAHPAPTRIQREGWPVLASKRNALLIAPTGSGKTLAAFLWAIDRVSRLDPEASPGVRILYVSPLKALVYDVERNLRAPLAGISAEDDGLPFRRMRVDVRTGDTPSKERRQQLRQPADVLVTTPESLYLLLGSRAAAHLKTVHTVIVDEIHALAGTKP